MRGVRTPVTLRIRVPLLLCMPLLLGGAGAALSDPAGFMPDGAEGITPAGSSMCSTGQSTDAKSSKSRASLLISPHCDSLLAPRWARRSRLFDVAGLPHALRCIAAAARIPDP